MSNAQVRYFYNKETNAVYRIVNNLRITEVRKLLVYVVVVLYKYMSKRYIRCLLSR